MTKCANVGYIEGGNPSGIVNAEKRKVQPKAIVTDNVMRKKQINGGKKPGGTSDFARG